MINSKIEWTHHTANLWWGCTKVHEGCDNCYASTMAHRWGFDVWGNDKYRREIKSVWKELKNYQKIASDLKMIHRVFVGSMMDVFEKPMPLIDSKRNIVSNKTTGDLRDKFFNEVVPSSPNLLFLLLSKRPSNINKYTPTPWKVEPPSNVMFGTSPVNQTTSVTLITQLQQVNGRKFLSVEPQLSEITLLPWLTENKIDWVIQGGESGPHKRPFNTDWARKIKAECTATNTPYFFKQIDKKQAIPEDLLVREFPTHLKLRSME